MKRALAIAAVFVPGKRVVVMALLLKYAKRKHPLWFDGEVVLAEVIAYAEEIIAAQTEVEYELLRAA